MQHFIHYTKHADASHISLCTFILASGSGYAFTPSTPYLSPCEINMKIHTGSECSRRGGGWDVRKTQRPQKHALQCICNAQVFSLKERRRVNADGLHRRPHQRVHKQRRFAAALKQVRQVLPPSTLDEEHIPNMNSRSQALSLPASFASMPQPL